MMFSRSMAEIMEDYFAYVKYTLPVMELKTTRDIGRQILRHRSFSFQEFSQRYGVVEAPPPVFREARLQDTKNRQASILTSDAGVRGWWEATQLKVAAQAASLYQEALDKGLAKEVARAILPEGNTQTTMYMAGTVRSWIHYVQERTQDGVQPEHREVAHLVKTALLRLVPELDELLG